MLSEGVDSLIVCWWVIVVRCVVSAQLPSAVDGTPDMYDVS